VVEHERVWAAVGERRVRFLTNVMGTWLLSETVRGWEAVGERIDLAELLEQQQPTTRPVALFDVQDPRFLWSSVHHERPRAGPLPRGRRR
jgi:rhamnulokinase